MWKQVLASPVGPLQAAWLEDGLYSFSFLRPSEISCGDPLAENCGEAENCAQSVPSDIEAAIYSDMPRRIRVLCRRLTEELESYFQTGELKWSLDHLDWTGVSDFHREVLTLCHSIPVGVTYSYGQLARLAGSPHAARAVGGAMARNRWPLIIPCHRVVGSSGKLTGYSGEGGLKTKHWLLEHEFHAAHGNLFSISAR